MNHSHYQDYEFTNIVISVATHRRLMALPIAAYAKSSAVLNIDGSVSISITPPLLSALKVIDDDPDTAIQLLLEHDCIVSR